MILVMLLIKNSLGHANTFGEKLMRPRDRLVLCIFLKASQFLEELEIYFLILRSLFVKGIDCIKLFLSQNVFSIKQAKRLSSFQLSAASFDSANIASLFAFETLEL